MNSLGGSNEIGVVWFDLMVGQQHSSFRCRKHVWKQDRVGISSANSSPVTGHETHTAAGVQKNPIFTLALHRLCDFTPAMPSRSRACRLSPCNREARPSQMPSRSSFCVFWAELTRRKESTLGCGVMSVLFEMQSTNVDGAHRPEDQGEIVAFCQG